jgi:dTMP kinase
MGRGRFITFEGIDGSGKSTPIARLGEVLRARGETVLCDRFADSTRVYQGVARAELRATVDALHALMIGVEPDLTLILDLDPEAARRRAAARGAAESRFEDFGAGFQRRLRAGFLALAAEFPDRCRIIPADGAPEAVALRVAEAVDAVAA